VYYETDNAPRWDERMRCEKNHPKATSGVSHSLALPIYIKKYLIKVKEKNLLCKFKYFTMQKYNLPKIKKNLNFFLKIL
jgi:hypothetical protein